jgi:membrane-associated PAP2 superfamily phosphatase
MAPVFIFFSGVSTAGFLVAAVFFARYWTRTREPLLGIFAAAFALMGVNNAIIGLADIPREERSVVYLVRLAAFVLIIVGIVWTNLRRTR